MDQALFNRCKALLLKHTPPDVPGRVAWTSAAWVNTPLLDHIRYEGSRNDFATLLLMSAVQFGTLADGRHALVALLQHLLQCTGLEDQATIQLLIAELERQKRAHE